MGKAMHGDRALFGLMPDHPDGHAGEYLFRCPVCDACTSSEVDKPCSPYCRSLANKPARRRTDSGGRRG